MSLSRIRDADGPVHPSLRPAQLPSGPSHRVTGMDQIPKTLPSETVDEPESLRLPESGYCRLLPKPYAPHASSLVLLPTPWLLASSNSLLRSENFPQSVC